MINKHCLEAFKKVEGSAYHPQEYFMLGWNAAIDALADAYQKQWEEDGIENQFLRKDNPEQIPEEDRE